MQASSSVVQSLNTDLTSSSKQSNVRQDSPVSPVLDVTSSEEFDEGDLCMDGQELSDLEDFSGHETKVKAPHFLDYVYASPPKNEPSPDEPTTCNPGERFKVDKRLERDGEVSDHEFAVACANGKLYKKESTKKKHFLDENPIPPPEYLKQTSPREHRSLDRNFLKDKESIPDRKVSLERELRKMKPDNYSLNRFIEQEVPNAYRGTWPAERPTDFCAGIKFGSMPQAAIDLGPKVECVYSLLNMLGSHDPAEMSARFLELSKNRETCVALRRSGCISILVQLLHSDSDETVRKKAGIALHNVVHCHIDDKSGRREVRVLKLIEQLIEYCDSLRGIISNGEAVADHTDRHPIQAIGTLMKTSFDEDHRHAMCQLGALQTISTLVQLDHEVHGAKSEDTNCITLRRYAGMTLTNLTFGDGNNKALLCSNKGFMKSLVMQIESNSDELVQVTASVLRNLSWRADTNMKQVLNEIGTVKILTKAAMSYSQENTLKSILSALWNLSNHCPTNKAEFCETEGAIDFLIDMLNYDAPSKTMAVIENAGGILRNISSYIATKEEYRQILRRRNCLGILLQQLKSSSLTVVSNASGTLGNLSANCTEDQKYLRDNGAIPMLRSLIHSKHKMISQGSTIALKNLLNYQKTGLPCQNLDSVSRALDLKKLPTLDVRKQRALEQELDQNLANSCESDELVTTPPKDETTKNIGTIGAQARNLMARFVKSAQISKSESKDSVSSGKSTKNDTSEQSSFDIETDCEQPIDYSRYASEPGASTSKTDKPKDYQETDLDQPVDFSKRYAENIFNAESDEDDRSSSFEQQQILMEEDSVKCYFTEGTPKIISNAGSITDLRTITNNAKEKQPLPLNNPSKSGVSRKPVAEVKPEAPVVACTSGIHSPEKPINYCEEGTPGHFSRSDSLSDLDEEGTGTLKPKTPNKVEKEIVPNTPPQPILDTKTENPASTGKSVTFSNFAQETPLMYSRTSSVESLESAGSVCVADDKSSVVSDFSRLASGIISPSELPDSPTQSIPHSPKQRALVRPQQASTPSATVNRETVTVTVTTNPSVFEDQTNAFGIENTPAQFSCATSLSNLSLDDEPKITKDCLVKEMQLMSHPSEEHEDGEDDDNASDNLLLENAISLGIQSHAIRQPGVGSSNPCSAGDSTKQYCTEDTPAHLSKAGSNTDLSVLSIATTGNGAESSNASDADDKLLEQAISQGIAIKSTSKSNEVPLPLPTQVLTENPIDKLRRGALPPYLPVNDETSKYGIEDSPRAFSIRSGLSELTVGSGAAALAKFNSGPVKPIQQVPLLEMESTLNDSLSSVGSADEEDTKLLNQAIAMGTNTLTKQSQRQEAQDSYSSIDSCDSMDNQNLLQEVVQSGINKVTKTGASTSTSTVPKVQNQSVKPVTRNQVKPEKNKNSLPTDEELLQEAINAGINMTTGKTVNPTQSIPIPKNVMNSTSVTVLPGATITSSDVEVRQTVQIDGTNAFVNEVFHHQQLATQNGSSKMTASNASMQSWMYKSNEYPALKLSSYEFNDSSVTDSCIDMEMSNEFMATTFTDSNSFTDKRKNPDLMLRSVDRLTQELVATAEYLRQTDPNCIRTAKERKTGSSNHTWNEDSASFPSVSIDAPNNMVTSQNEDDNTFNDVKSTYSNNGILCEEPTPTNECKFFVEKVVGERKSVDYVLKEASLDATLRYDDVDGPESFDTVRNAQEFYAEGPEIKFQLGGEVNVPGISLTYSSSGPMSIDSCSTMTNSTIICMEANKVAADLQNYSPTDSLASIDIDNIRPPSVMDCVSLSTVPLDITAPQSPQLSKIRKKSLPSGLMARRALGQLTRGSAENINSIGYSNLDNVKPPSIMDELLDSMVSIASIASEVADNTTMPLNLESGSHYETALSEIDDTTLQSCMDLPNDSTPIASDFSSNESTPVRGEAKRSLTPKQKRQLAKDRFKTYTIAAGSVGSNEEKPEEDEILQVEVQNVSPRRLTPREKRKEDRSRFETQVLDMSGMNLLPSTGGTGNSPLRRRLEDPNRFKTRTLSCNDSEPLSVVLKEANVVIQTLNQARQMSDEFLLDEAASDCISLVSNDDYTEDLSIKAVTAHLRFIRDLPKTSHIPTQLRPLDDGSDLTSLEYEQNSETESCDQNRYYDNDSDEAKMVRPRITKPTNDLYLDSAGDEGNSSPEPRGVRGRKKPAYVSPYKRTSLNTPRTVSPKQVPANMNTRTNLATKQDSTKKSSTGKSSQTKTTTKSQVIVAKTQSFMSKTNLTNKINNIKSGLKPVFTKGKSTEVNTTTMTKTTISKSKTFTEISSHCSRDTPPQMPDRQGTFIKEEGTDLNVPIVISAPTTPSKTSKLPTKIPPAKSVATTSKTITSRFKIPLYKGGGGQGSTAGTPVDPQKRKNSGVYKSPSVPSVPMGQRSNSNSSIRSATGTTNKKDQTLSPARSASSVTPAPKKDITSKIAGIWKKIDETKKQQANKKDTRVWIGSKQKPEASGKPPVPPTHQLIRSSTFDATPEDGQLDRGLPVITKARTLKSPSSGNLKGIATGVEKRCSGLLNGGFKRN